MTLELSDIHKAFGETRANDGVTLRLEAGSIHGLLGENGAGKSTLMKILSGYLSADSGEIVLDGTPLRLSSPEDAIRAGIGMLHQDPLVFLPFSVLDNLLLGSRTGLRLDRGAGARELARVRDRFGFSLDPDAPTPGRRPASARGRRCRSPTATGTGPAPGRAQLGRARARRSVARRR